MLANLFPFMNWIKDYNTETLRSDTIAGLTVALVLIPQSMAYAQLAGLPAYYGLYASFLTPFSLVVCGRAHRVALPLLCDSFSDFRQDFFRLG